MPATDARIIWQAELDPATVSVSAVPGDISDPDHVDLSMLEPWLTLVTDITGRERVVLSDGRRRFRLDIDSGSLASGAPVVLHYRMFGLASAETKLLTLRRFIDLCRNGRFSTTLFPADPRAGRLLLPLRVCDALRAGATQREIAIELYGPERVGTGWVGEAESLRSRVRRLVRDARSLAAGGWRRLLMR